MTDRCFALIPAAGVGTRAGAAIPKQYLPVADIPMIVHALVAFTLVEAIDRIAVVIAPQDRWFDALALDASVANRVDVYRVGGGTRAETVANGLDAMRGTTADDDWVLVHDAARCGITAALIANLVGRVRSDPVGGLLAVPLDDTVKRAEQGADQGATTTRETVDRLGLWRAQTPQMFRRRALADALADARSRGIATTDESSAIEAAGHRTLLVPGSPRNFKVTTADDLAMMDRLLRAEPRFDGPLR